MPIREIETHIRKIEETEVLHERFLEAVGIYTQVTGLCGVDSSSQEKNEIEILEKVNTRKGKKRFVEKIEDLTKEALGVRSLQEAKGLLANITIRPNCFSNAIKRLEAIGHVIRHTNGSVFMKNLRNSTKD